MQQFFLNLCERASLSLGIAGLNGSDWNPRSKSSFLCSSILCYLQSRSATQPQKQKIVLVHQGSLAASCCLVAEREDPMPAALLGLLLFKTFSAISTKVSCAVGTRFHQNDLLEALHPLQQEQCYVPREQRQLHPQISGGQATASGEDW